MPRKAYFCYEKDFASRWCPVVYYDHPPQKQTIDKTIRSEIHPVPIEWCGENEVNCSFASLQVTFPAPVALKNEIIEAIPEEEVENGTSS